MIKQKELKAFKVRGRWRIRKKDLEMYLSQVDKEWMDLRQGIWIELDALLNLVLKQTAYKEICLINTF